jgi:hypothetical protein
LRSTPAVTAWLARRQGEYGYRVGSGIQPPSPTAATVPLRAAYLEGLLLGHPPRLAIAPGAWGRRRGRQRHRAIVVALRGMVPPCGILARSAGSTGPGEFCVSAKSRILWTRKIPQGPGRASRTSEDSPGGWGPTPGVCYRAVATAVVTRWSRPLLAPLAALRGEGHFVGDVRREQQSDGAPGAIILVRLAHEAIRGLLYG